MLTRGTPFLWKGPFFEKFGVVLRVDGDFCIVTLQAHPYAPIVLPALFVEAQMLNLPPEGP